MSSKRPIIIEINVEKVLESSLPLTNFLVDLEKSRVADKFIFFREKYQYNSIVDLKGRVINLDKENKDEKYITRVKREFFLNISEHLFSILIEIGALFISENFEIGQNKKEQLTEASFSNLLSTDVSIYFIITFDTILDTEENKIKKIFSFPWESMKIKGLTEEERIYYLRKVQSNNVNTNPKIIKCKKESVILIIDTTEHSFFHENIIIEIKKEQYKSKYRLELEESNPYLFEFNFIDSDNNFKIIFYRPESITQLNSTITKFEPAIIHLIIDKITNDKDDIVFYFDSKEFGFNKDNPTIEIIKISKCSIFIIEQYASSENQTDYQLYENFLYYLAKSPKLKFDTVCLFPGTKKASDWIDIKLENFYKNISENNSFFESYRALYQKCETDFIHPIACFKTQPGIPESKEIYIDFKFEIIENEKSDFGNSRTTIKTNILEKEKLQEKIKNLVRDSEVSIYDFMRYLIAYEKDVEENSIDSKLGVEKYKSNLKRKYSFSEEELDTMKPYSKTLREFIDNLVVERPINDFENKINSNDNQSHTTPIPKMPIRKDDIFNY